MPSFADTPTTSPPAPTSSSHNCSSNSSSQSSSSMDQFVTKNDVLKAEVLWVLKVVTSHFSYKSCEGLNGLFLKMFPDSKIAEKFACGESKCARMARFGLAPHFKSLLVESINHADNFVLLFDESLNFENQKTQLDVHIRSWQADKVSSRYFGSEFLGHGNAKNLVEHVSKCIEQLYFLKCLQISMDGPNVNWKFYKDITLQIKTDFNNDLIDIGSCGLHILHGAFKTAIEKNKLFGELESLFSSVYWLFKDSPARRDDFEKITGSSCFPIKFCKHRWLANLPVAQRFLLVWENIKKFVQAVDRKQVSKPKCKSFTVAKDNVANEMVVPMTQFYITLAQEIYPFLERYQCDKPMIPFLGQDLFNLLRALMQRFLKSDIMSSLTSQYKVVTFDIKNESNYCTAKKVSMGRATKRGKGECPRPPT